MSQFFDGWGSTILNDLIETEAPNGISWWPQTVGWQIVLLITVLVIISKLIKKWQQYKRNAYRRDAIAWLEHLPPFEDINQQPVFRELPSLLRKVALGGYNRSEVTQLTGQAWLAWLNQQCHKTCFSLEQSEALKQLAFDPNVTLSVTDMAQLILQIRLWIEHHRGAYD